MNITDYSTILDPRVKSIVTVSPATMEEEFKKYTNVYSDNQLQNVVTSAVGLGMGQITADGAVAASDAPIQGFTKVVTQAQLQHRARLSYMTFSFLAGGLSDSNLAKLDAELKSKIMDLKNSIVMLKNYLGQSILANGFSSSFTFTPINSLVTVSSLTIDTTGLDGVSIWNAAHPREDGGTAWSNIVNTTIVGGSTNNPTFSFTGFLAARAQHSVKKDGRGNPLQGSQLDTLYCVKGSAVSFLARSIASTLASGKVPAITSATLTQSAQTNAILFNDSAPTGSFEVVELENWGGTGLTSAMWFMADSKKRMKGFGLQYIQTKETQVLPVFMDLAGNLDYVFNVVEFGQFGCGDFRFWMASNGTNA